MCHGQWKMFSCFSKNHTKLQQAYQIYFLQWQYRRRRWFCVEGCRGSVLTFSDMVAWSGRGLVTCWHHHHHSSCRRTFGAEQSFWGQDEMSILVKTKPRSLFWRDLLATSNHSVSVLGHNYTPTFRHLHSALTEVRTRPMLPNILIHVWFHKGFYGISKVHRTRISKLGFDSCLVRIFHSFSHGASAIP